MSDCEAEPTTRLFGNSDLFDTQGDSDSDADRKSNKHNWSPSTPLIEREESEHIETPPKTRRRRRQPQKSAERATKMTKAAINRMHSESQRMIRESRVSLPTYQPKVKTLDSFLTRLKSRTPVDSHKETMRKAMPSKAIVSPLSTVGTTTVTTTDSNQQTSGDVQKELSESHPSSLMLDPGSGGNCDKTEDKLQGSDTDHLEASSSAPETTLKQERSSENNCSLLSTCSLTPFLTGPKANNSSFLPKLSSVGDWEEEMIDLSTSPAKPSAVELLQLRFLRHAKPQFPGADSTSCTARKMDCSVENSNRDEQGSASPCVPKEVMNKLAHKPGAIRSYLKEVLCKRLSLQKAEERKRAEELRKMDNEEVEPGNLSEMEAELSDEEYEDELDSSEEEEDHRDEKGEANPVLSDSSISNNHVEENYSSGDSGQIDSDDDDDDVLPVSRQLKFSLRKSWVLDSDDESHGDMASTESSPQRNELKQSQSRFLAEDKYTLALWSECSGSAVDKNSVIPTQQASMSSEEASMGPLVSGGSSGDGSEVSDKQSHDQVEQLSNKATIFQGKFERTPVDIGVGFGLEDTSSSQHTQILYEEKEGSVGGDSSLNEMTFFSHSLAPAQEIRREDSEELFTPATMSRQDSLVSSRSDKDENTQSLSAWQQTSTHSISKTNLRSVLDEETQFLDANGYLCNRSIPNFNSHSSTIQKVVETSNDISTQDFLALCSGRFETQKGDLQSVEHPRHLSDITNNSSTGVHELLGLPSTRGRQSSVGEQVAMSSDDTQDSNMNEVLGLCSGALSITAAMGPKRTMLTDQHDNFGTSDGSSSNEDADVPMVVKRKKRFRSKPKPTRGERLQEFVESEAELSGSEGVSADEEEEGEDEYEEDEGADLDVPDSDTELRKQVNKAHMRQLLADDKADLREFKERFLVEGDLYEDGVFMRNGFFRTRRFAHDSETSVDLFAEDRQLLSGSDKEDEETMSSQVEAQRRKERLEKEDFLRKCRQREGSLLNYDEDSQSILEMINESSCPPAFRTPEPSLVPVTTASAKRSRCGSFLKHGSTTLQRLSSYTAATPNVSNSNRAFVFQTDSASRDSSSSGGSKAKKKVPATLPNKRLRLERSVSHTDSIFNRLIK